MKQHLRHSVYLSPVLRGAPPDFCGGEDTDLPNATSTAGTLLCMTLLMANWIASFFFFGCQMGAVGNEITSDTVV